MTWLLDVGLVPGAGLVLGEAWKWPEPQVSWIVGEWGARPGSKHGPGCRQGTGSQELLKRSHRVRVESEAGGL